MAIIKDANDPNEVPGQSPKGGGSGKDPVDEALAVKRKLMASDITETEAARIRADRAKAEAEARKAEVEAKRAEAGGEEVTKAGFKFTGGVDLGHIDLAQERKEAQDELKRLKGEADESARATGQENQQLRDKINEQNIKFLQITFNSQMEQLTKMLEANTSKKNFIEQYTEALETAKALGLAQPSPGSSDLQTTLALKKLEFDQATELRKMAREEKRADRDFQRQLNVDAEDREARKSEQARQERRDDMVAKAPQMIGGAIAQGLLANQGKGGTVAQESTEEAPPSETGAQKGHHVEAGWGESGEVECPGCNHPVGIGPTARAAVCANCGERVSIRRTGERPSQ